MDNNSQEAKKKDEPDCKRVSIDALFEKLCGDVVIIVEEDSSQTIEDESLKHH